jgi:hypothetical protein
MTLSVSIQQCDSGMFWFSNPLLRRVLVIALGAAAVTSTAFAKRSNDYIPPPYFSRFLYSLVGVVPLSLILIAICVLAMLYVGSTGSAIRRFLLVSGALVVAGCLLAATDWLNDELWQPWLWAGLFVTFVPTAAIYLAGPGPSPSKWVLIVLSLVPTWLVLTLCGSLWQVWAFHHGIPASW